MPEIALAAYLACFAGDGATTHIAFHRFPGQVRELFLTQNPTVNDAIIAAQATGVLWATSKIERPWLKWTVRLGVASVHGWAAVHNARVMAQAGRMR